MPRALTSSSGSKSDVGVIVGGGLALIGIFVLAVLFLMRKYKRNRVSSEAASALPPRFQEWERDDPKIPESDYRKYGGYGLSELPTMQEPAELGS